MKQERMYTKKEIVDMLAETLLGEFSLQEGIRSLTEDKILWYIWVFDSFVGYLFARDGGKIPKIPEIEEYRAKINSNTIYGIDSYIP